MPEFNDNLTGYPLKKRSKSGPGVMPDMTRLKKLAALRQSVGELKAAEAQRRQAEQALQESEERYRALVETAPDVVYIISSEGKLTSLNPAFETITGWTRAEWLGKPFAPLVHPEDLALAIEKFQKVLHGATPPPFELRIVSKSGKYLVGEFTATPYVKGGKVAGNLGVVRDITDRKQTEERNVKLGSLKHRLLGTGDLNEKLKLITEGVVGIFGADFARIWLTKESDLCEKGCRHAAVVEGPNACRNRTHCLHLAASSGRYTQLEGSHRRVPLGCYKIGRVASGEDARFITNNVTIDPRVHDHEWAKSLGLVSFAGFRLESAENKPVGVLALFSQRVILPDEQSLLEDLANATSQVILTAMAEEERRKLEAQMQQAQKLESLGVLAGGIAHDFNNLLTAILGHANLALTDLPPESPARESLQGIEGASRRAAELCRQMLAYSGRGRFIVEQLNLSRLAQELTHLLQVSISKKVMLHCHFADRLPPVEADAVQARQVIMNLVINASEAIGDKKGVIDISTGAMQCEEAYLRKCCLGESLSAGTYVYFEVMDTGCGMDAETRSRIFDPFFTTKFSGRGLGLAAVQGIMRQHKGAIKVDSQPGTGTTFRVLFPASKKSTLQPKPGATAGLWRGNGTVLVVDDEKVVREVTQKMMEYYGFSVLAAADGREAVKLFQENQDRIACVLLDLTMPHMDGEETYRELSRIRNDVRVIMASGYSEQEISQRFAGKGVAGFIEKPFKLATLNAKLREVLTQERATAEDDAQA
jgi:PAS domain S-box-containing protein